MPAIIWKSNRRPAGIIGPAGDDKIPGIDEAVDDGDTISFGGHAVQISPWAGIRWVILPAALPDAGLAFVGDSLFALKVVGCLKAQWRKWGP